MALTPADFLKAEAIAYWVKSTIGVKPQIINYNDEYLEVEITEAQKKIWNQYLNQKLKSGLIPVKGAPLPTVQIRLGQVIVPWALQYLIPAALLFFVVGRLSVRK